MSFSEDVLNLLNKFLKKDHQYQILIVEIIICYFVYLLYQETIKKYFNYKAYRIITYQQIHHSGQLDLEESNESEIQKQQKSKKSINDKLKQKDESKKNIQQQESNMSMKELLKQEKHLKHLQGKEKTQITGAKVNHPLFLSAAKGFSDYISDFSFNNRYLVTASYDQTIRLFDMSQFFLNADNPKSIFYTLHDMHATAICISKKLDLIHFAAHNQLFQLQFNPKADPKSYFHLTSKTSNCHKGDIIGIHSDDQDRIVITVGSDTFIKIWSLNGSLLKELNTSYQQHYGSQLIQNYLTVSAWSQDTSIFEIKFKDNQFRTIEKEMTLKGDKGSILDSSIDEHCKRAIIVNSQSVKMYNLDVDHKAHESIKVIGCLKESNSYVAATMNAYLTLVSDGFDLLIYDKENKLLDKIEVAANGQKIKKIRLHELHSNAKNKTYLVCLVMGQEDRRINLFNLTKYYQQ